MGRREESRPPGPPADASERGRDRAHAQRFRGPRSRGRSRPAQRARPRRDIRESLWEQDPLYGGCRGVQGERGWGEGGGGGGRGGCAGESVSRVLCAGLRPFGLRPRRRPFLWDGGCPPPPAAYPEVMAVRATPRDPEIPPSLCGLAPGGACRAGRVAAAAVGSYPAVSPLPRPLRAVAVCFLLRFPWPCGRWALPTTLLCGARTFLEKPLARFPRSPGLPCKGDGTGTFLTK